MGCLEPFLGVQRDPPPLHRASSVLRPGAERPTSGSPPSRYAVRLLWGSTRAKALQGGRSSGLRLWATSLTVRVIRRIHARAPHCAVGVLPQTRYPSAQARLTPSLVSGLIILPGSGGVGADCSIPSSCSASDTFGGSSPNTRLLQRRAGAFSSERRARSSAHRGSPVSERRGGSPPPRGWPSPSLPMERGGLSTRQRWLIREQTDYEHPQLFA